MKGGEMATMEHDNGDAIALRTVRSGRIRQLDGLRGIAVTLVVASHFLQRDGSGHGIARLVLYPLTNGLLGVEIFFVLSGYLITALLLDEKATRRSVFADSMPGGHYASGPRSIPSWPSSWC
jgi:uncharacterized membrane protein